MKYFVPEGIIDSASELCSLAANERERLILAQLNDFIARGLIEVEVGQCLLTRESNSAQIKYVEQITLKLKDKKYIESLERENNMLREELTILRGNNGKA